MKAMELIVKLIQESHGLTEDIEVYLVVDGKIHEVGEAEEINEQIFLYQKP